MESVESKYCPTCGIRYKKRKAKMDKVWVGYEGDVARYWIDIDKFISIIKNKLREE